RRRRPAVTRPLVRAALPADLRPRKTDAVTDAAAEAEADSIRGTDRDGRGAALGAALPPVGRRPR
ncbi:hypothetical protein, partial [Streptomyces scabiei]